MILDRRVAQSFALGAAVALGTIVGLTPGWGDDGTSSADLSAAETMTPTTTATDDAAAKEVKDIPEGATGEEVAVEKPAAKATKSHGRRIEQADSFIATPDWEFDGFVAGGKGQSYRSIFYLSDLVFFNVGTRHGLAPGDRVGIYKRGERVRDPQTGRFLGYEVRRAAMSQITDKIDDTTATARILTTYEAVEIGDLVRREN